jgi:outer membrane protein TolC
MENTAEARVENLKAEIAEAEQQLADLTGVDPGRFEQRTLVPTKTSVKLLRYDVVWVH